MRTLSIYPAAAVQLKHNDGTWQVIDIADDAVIVDSNDAGKLHGAVMVVPLTLEQEQTA